MAEPALTVESGATPATAKGLPQWLRLLVYILTRAVTIVITSVVAVYLTIIVANMGGKVDEIRKAEIDFNVRQMAVADESLRHLSVAEYNRVVEARIQQEYERQGLNQNFWARSVRYLWKAITLDLGQAERLTSDSGSSWVRQIILERLFPTLLLFASAQLLIFFLGIFVALALSRRYGSWLDRTVIALAPTSAAPSWFYGIFLILFFAAMLRVFPFGGMVKAPPPTDRFEYALSVLKHLTLPVLAQVLSSVFHTIYSWRTFFLIYSSEDYVEMAKAKGLTSGQIERRYVLRPTLPTILTSFTLLLISLWTGAIVLETVFNWPGLGRLIYEAIQKYDTPVVVGTTVIYAYLLGLTVFLLDFLYALVDPRVKVGSGGRRA